MSDQVTEDQPAAFVCPFCSAVSHNPNDASQRYCGCCHVYVDDVLDTSPAVRTAMVRFNLRMAEVRPEHTAAALRAAEIWGHGLP
jgi:hypothetical protein